MDNVLKGMKGVVCRVDDILVTAPTIEEHIARLREVIRRLEDAGFRCKWEKSKFLMEKITYLGFDISKDGIEPHESKVETLIKMQYPRHLKDLISFLGAVQYYGRFIPNMSTLVEPLNRLRTSEWQFGDEEKRSFDELKEVLASSRVLIFYDPDLPVRIDADANSYGLGAVINRGVKTCNVNAVIVMVHFFRYLYFYSTDF